jgi:hypothetical protein
MNRKRLGDQPWQRCRNSGKVIEEVIATPLIIGTGLWKKLSCVRADDTGAPGYALGLMPGTKKRKRGIKTFL